MCIMRYLHAADKKHLMNMNKRPRKNVEKDPLEFTIYKSIIFESGKYNFMTTLPFTSSKKYSTINNRDSIIFSY